MNYTYTELVEKISLEDLRIDVSLEITDFGGQCSVDGYIAIPILHLSARYQRSETFQINLDSHSQAECYLVSCKGEVFTYGEAPAILAAAYLRDTSLGDLQETQSFDYLFKYDYVVLESQYYESYAADYQNSSAVWGGFSHEAALNINEKITGVSSVRAIAGLQLPTVDHQTATLRAIYDSTPLGHYLALFHLIELSFDYDLVEDIKRLGADLKGIGKLLATYNNTEYQRLLRLIQKYWKDENSLGSSLRDFFRTSSHDSVIDELLYAYDKDGFPWSFKDNLQKRSDFIIHSKHSFDKASIKQAGFGWTLDHLQRATAYIVYRFRCAIAHASIGEHILTVNDSKLVSEKAEPLLINLIAQMYKRPPQ
ncbi:hypothetical protein [Pseudomonas borbori]|uniref:Uncharacterized protein n=1 Tax=Pseudomonas borbori TaxID=289003 RepID=A0A1I5XPF6_9PSED|nr:hypothetical protein [Pseudomonas borbori]SFQ33863.1 hypothetical protein SAMN05216190_1714 [Pseudomonas borbori]